MIKQGRVAFAWAWCTLATMIASAAWAASTASSTTQPVEVQPATTQSSPNRSAAVVQLHGDIDDTNRDALYRRFRQARKLGADTIILDINTYGGLVTSGLDISRFLKQQDDVHVIAYVGE